MSHESESLNVLQDALKYEYDVVRETYTALKKEMPLLIAPFLVFLENYGTQCDGRETICAAFLTLSRKHTDEFEHMFERIRRSVYFMSFSESYRNQHEQFWEYYNIIFMINVITGAEDTYQKYAQNDNVERMDLLLSQVERAMSLTYKNENPAPYLSLIGKDWDWEECRKAIGG